MKSYPEIRRRFRGVGPVRVSIGTADVRVVRRVRGIVDDLQRFGRQDYLAALRDGKVAPMELLERVRACPDLRQLPPAEVPLFTRAKIAAFLKQLTATPRHLNDTRLDLHRLLGVMGARSSAEALPKALRKLREVYRTRDQFRAFNKMRSSVLSFLRDTAGRRASVYLDVLDIEVLPTKRKRRGNPQSPGEAWRLAEALGAWGPAWLTMCGTGMGPSELWGRWEAHEDRVAIHGTKRTARERVVFRVLTPSRPPASYRLFREALAEASDGAVQPYDGRRTFAHWCEAAGLPPSRIDLYLGHGPRGMLGLYTEHEAGKYLVEDGKRVRAWLAKKGGRESA